LTPQSPGPLDLFFAISFSICSSGQSFYGSCGGFCNSFSPVITSLLRREFLFRGPQRLQRLPFPSPSTLGSEFSKLPAPSPLSDFGPFSGPPHIPPQLVLPPSLRNFIGCSPAIPPLGNHIFPPPAYPYLSFFPFFFRDCLPLVIVEGALYPVLFAVRQLPPASRARQCFVLRLCGFTSFSHHGVDCCRSEPYTCLLCLFLRTPGAAHSSLRIKAGRLLMSTRALLLTALPGTRDQIPHQLPPLVSPVLRQCERIAR